MITTPDINEPTELKQWLQDGEWRRSRSHEGRPSLVVPSQQNPIAVLITVPLHTGHFSDNCLFCRFHIKEKTFTRIKIGISPEKLFARKDGNI